MKISLFQAVIAFATLSIKSLLIFNGGAILALLTFYGNVLARAEGSTVDVGSLTQSITAFVWGVGTALFCSITSYITQVIFTEVGNEKKCQIWGNVFRVLAVLAGIASFGFFICGSFESIEVLDTLIVPEGSSCDE